MRESARSLRLYASMPPDPDGRQESVPELGYDLLSMVESTELSVGGGGGEPHAHRLGPECRSLRSN